MTAPAEAASRFAQACLLGGGLGLVYGFLRPLRIRHPHLADLLFVPALFWAWLYLGFAVCAGDIRLGYTAGLLVGALAWEGTAGKGLRPVFTQMWKLLGAAWELFILPGKKIIKICTKIGKKLFAIGRKWVTIKRNQGRKKKGGAAGGRQKDPRGFPQGQSGPEDRRSGAGGAVHGDTSDGVAV